MPKERPSRWLSTEQTATSRGMSSQWVRRQIEAGRLVAFSYTTGWRRTYRIRLDGWQSFRAAYRHRASWG